MDISERAHWKFSWDLVEMRERGLWNSINHKIRDSEQSEFVL